MLWVAASLVPRPRPAFHRFPYCKRRKAGRGLGTRLVAILSMADMVCLDCMQKLQCMRNAGSVCYVGV